MQMIICIFASLFSYQGMVVLPHDPATGKVGIIPTNGAICESAMVKMANPPVLKPGQLVSVSGDIQIDGRNTYRFITDLRIIGQGQPPKFEPVTAKTLNSGKAVGRLVSFKGVVQDVFRDDIDDYVFASISDGDSLVFWAGASKADDSQLKDIIGATVEASGIAVSGDFTARRKFGPTISSTSLESLAVLSRATKSLFDVPDIDALDHTPPSDIAFQPRHRASGSVLAVLNDQTFLIRRTNDMFTTIHLAFAGVPSRGDFIDAVGFPESDLYSINLSRAAWRKSDLHPSSLARDKDIDRIRDYSSPSRGESHLPTPRESHHGYLLKIRGIVKHLPIPGEPANTALIESDGHFLEIKPGLSKHLFDGLKLGSTIAVTGIAFIEKEHWRPNLIFPRVLHKSLVPRGPEDIEVISGPPFWTPLKFLVLIVFLIVMVVAALLRNRTVLRLSEERVKERTRLAAELHDTIAQNLTGAAIQLETAESLASNGPGRLKQILASAVKILHVSREELRDCIWDLRNQTLDEKYLEDAIRRTLLPHLCGTRLKIRFHVNRADIRDRSVHAAVSITRELVANAIHHGHPSMISIAGTLDGDSLKFSVVDDGCGFDVAHAPGPKDGHFGLTGIRERIRKLNGTFDITSKDGVGTKAAIALPR